MAFLYQNLKNGLFYLYDNLMYPGEGVDEDVDSPPIPPVQYPNPIPIPANTNTVLAPTGKWNTVCQVCGIKVKANTSRKRWDGLLVCHDDWEPRHVLDFIRSQTPRISLAPVSPEPADVFIVQFSIEQTTGQADIGTADLALADRIIII